jgi:hypothetical protein
LNILKEIGRYFARKSYCRNAIDDHADLSIFKKKPSSRVIIGLLLIAASYILGLPTAVILGIIVAAQGNAMLSAIAALLLYGISWLIFMAGLYLAGPEYGKALNRWLTRIILENILGQEAKSPCPLPPEVSGNLPPKN